MRSLCLAAVLALAAVPAFAQGASPGVAMFQNLTAAEAARLNEAARNDPKARAALDEAERQLTEAGHPSGRLLRETRP